MKNVLAMILAGGRGRRLLPLTAERAKPAVPFGGIYRIIDSTLSNCINSRIYKVLVLTQYKSVSLNRHLRMGWSFLPPQLGQYVDAIPAQQRLGEKWYRGTADAIYQNIYSIERESCDTILVLSGDHIYKMDYARLVARHRDSGAAVTVCAVEVPQEDAYRFGVFEVGDDGRIVRFLEKPRKQVPFANGGKVLASMGVYVFSRDFITASLPSMVESGGFDFGRDIIPALIVGGGVGIYRFHPLRDGEECYWRDVGTIDAYWEANMDLVSVRPSFNLYDSSWPLRTFHGDYPPAKFVYSGRDAEGRAGTAMDCIVSAGCIVSGGVVRHSVLSPCVRINSYSYVVDSILMERVEVGRHARLNRVIVDKGVKIPAGIEIGFDNESDRKRFTVTESGIVVIPKGYVFD